MLSTESRGSLTAVQVTLKHFGALGAGIGIMSERDVILFSVLSKHLESAPKDWPLLWKEELPALAMAWAELGGNGKMQVVEAP
jgi:hypothetical protein